MTDAITREELGLPWIGCVDAYGGDTGIESEAGHIATFEEQGHRDFVLRVVNSYHAMAHKITSLECALAQSQGVVRRLRAALAKAEGRPHD